MILNSKAVSLSDAAVMLGMPEQQVLRLAQCGLIGQAPLVDGKTMLYLQSVEKYAKNNSIKLQKVPIPPSSRFGSFSIEDAMNKLGITERQIHLHIQAGRLRAYFRDGQYVVDAGSVRELAMGGEGE